MKPESGYTSAELLISIFMFISLAVFVAGIYALVHFAVKFW